MVLKTLADQMVIALNNAGLRRLVKKPKLVELGQRALAQGRELFRKSQETIRV